MLNAESVLVLGPHTDDAELGCGGTIARLVDGGSEVVVTAFSTAAESLPDGLPRNTLKNEFLQAVPKLGVPPENVRVFDYPVRKMTYHRQDVLEDLVKLRKEFKPTMVLLPGGGDLHQDHQVLHAEGLRAFKETTILGYELPWNHITFSSQAFVALDEDHLRRKWSALQAYRTQFDLERFYFDEELIRSIARVRGSAIKSKYAESFEVYRMRL